MTVHLSYNWSTLDRLIDSVALSCFQKACNAHSDINPGRSSSPRCGTLDWKVWEWFLRLWKVSQLLITSCLSCRLCKTDHQSVATLPCNRASKYIVAQYAESSPRCLSSLLSSLALEGYRSDLASICHVLGVMTGSPRVGPFAAR